MAYRAPRFCLLHAAQLAGVAAITTPAGTFTTGSQAALIDERAYALASWTASGTGREIRLDRGAGTLEAITRLIIPSGHNLATFTSIAVDADDNAGFSSPATLYAATAASSGQVDVALTSSTERYVRLTIAGTGTPSLGELIYTRTRTTAGVLDPEWDDVRAPNLVEFTSRSGVGGRLVAGAARRTLSLSFSWQQGSDAALLDDLVTAYAAGRALWVDPPSDADAAFPAYVTRVERSQDHPVPGTSLSYTYSVDLQEVLG